MLTLNGSMGTGYFSKEVLGPGFDVWPGVVGSIGRAKNEEKNTELIRSASYEYYAHHEKKPYFDPKDLNRFSPPLTLGNVRVNFVGYPRNFPQPKNDNDILQMATSNPDPWVSLQFMMTNLDLRDPFTIAVLKQTGKRSEVWLGTTGHDLYVADVRKEHGQIFWFTSVLQWEQAIKKSGIRLPAHDALCLRKRKIYHFWYEDQGVTNLEHYQDPYKGWIVGSDFLKYIDPTVGYQIRV